MYSRNSGDIFGYTLSSISFNFVEVCLRSMHHCRNRLAPRSITCKDARRRVITRGESNWRLWSCAAAIQSELAVELPIVFFSFFVQQLGLRLPVEPAHVKRAITKGYEIVPHHSAPNQVCPDPLARRIVRPVSSLWAQFPRFAHRAPEGRSIRTFEQLAALGLYAREGHHGLFFFLAREGGSGCRN